MMLIVNLDMKIKVEWISGLTKEKVQTLNLEDFHRKDSQFLRMFNQC